MLDLATGMAQDGNATITLIIENVMNNKGKILAGLHTAETFMKGPGVANAQKNALPGSVTFTFEGVSPGTYAISTMHDENLNYQMDFTPGGMPAEQYAVSGTDNKIGPPSFESCKFEVNGEDVSINLRF